MVKKRNQNRKHTITPFPPRTGCYCETHKVAIPPNEKQRVISNVIKIGGERGWYFGNWLWKLRGTFDSLLGGVGMRKGRTHAESLVVGDQVDFWRVLKAEQSPLEVLLLAEMKLPGTVWLRYTIAKKAKTDYLLQSTIFEPKGFLGKLYWKLVFPFHYVVFEGMAKSIVSFVENKP